MEVGDKIRFEIICDSPSQRAVNVVHFIVTEKTGAGASLADMCIALNDRVHTNYKSLMPPPARYMGVRGTKYFPLPPSAPVAIATREGPGTATGSLLPGPVTGLITFRTEFSGRKYRGRLYMPFPSEENNVAGGVPDAGYQVGLGNVGGAVRNTLVGGFNPNLNTAVMIIQGRNENARITPVTGHVARAYWGIQRRRGEPSGVDVLPPI